LEGNHLDTAWGDNEAR